MKSARLFVAPAVLACVSVFGACGGNKLPPVPLRPVPSAAASTSSTAKAVAKNRPAPIAGSVIGSYGDGTFGPRVVRGSKGSIVVSAPRSDTGRRWMAVALDDKDTPLSSERHEIAEAPEDSSAWDVKATENGFVLAWTRQTEAGEQLFAVSLAVDGAPRSVPTPVAKSGDDLVAVRIVPLEAGALLTWGEKTLPKGGTAAVGALVAVPLDALGRPTAQPTRIAERLSAWQVAATGPATAVAAIVQRVEPSKDPKLAARDDLARTAKAISLGIGPKGLTTSDAVALSGDEALPEIDVVQTSPGRALIAWSDRREVDAHVFAQSLELSAGNKPKPLGTPRRSVPPRGEQALVSLVPLNGGAALMYETLSPRSIKDPRRRFDVAPLSQDGDALATPHGFLFPYEDDEPELARAGDDAVAVLTYGHACMANGDAQPTCNDDELRPFVLRYGGPTLSPRQADLLDVGDKLGGAAQHAFDLWCTSDKSGRCDALVEGPGNPAAIAIAKTTPRKEEPKLRWVFRDHAETPTAPPRLEAATAIARENEFTGLHATRAGAGTLVAWITWAPDDAEVEASAEIEPKKKKKNEDDAAPKPKKKKSNPEALGARVAVRLLDGSGEPVAPVAVLSERALSKGDVAVAWGAGEKDGGVVAYVSRAEGDEEVYVARVTSKGLKEGKSSRITHAPGAASDVALTALPDGGYLLAWVEARGKNAAPAVWAVKLDKQGGKVGAEVKIGGGVGGDLSDLSLATIGSGSTGARIVATWSDAREDAVHGFGDVWFTVIGSKKLEPVAAEKAIARTKLHSHHPVAAARGDGGALVAWLEDDPSVSEALELVGKPEWGAYFARIDGNGAVVQGATQLSLDPDLGKGMATAVGADCPTGPSSCRVAVAWAAHDGIGVLAAPLGAATASTNHPARLVWSYHGAPSQEVAPAVVGSAVYLCEDGLEKDDGRVRRLSVSW